MIYGSQPVTSGIVMRNVPLITHTLTAQERDPARKK